MESSVGFRPLDEKSLVEYIKVTPALSAELGNQLDGLTVKEVGDGNLNFVYIVIGPAGSFVIKQLRNFVAMWSYVGTLRWLFSQTLIRFCERAQALIHGDLHTGSVMVTSDSTQIIDPEFAFYGPMGFDIGAFLGNLILAFFAQDGHAGQGTDRELYKIWILRTIEDTWNLFQEKFISLWNEHKEGSGDAYPSAIYNEPELHLLIQKKYIEDLFHDSLGFGAAKMIRRIVGIAHVEDFESITDASKRAYCEHRALEFAKKLIKGRRSFQNINQVLAAIQEFSDKYSN